MAVYVDRLGRSTAACISHIARAVTEHREDTACAWRGGADQRRDRTQLPRRNREDPARERGYAAQDGLTMCCSIPAEE